MATEGFHFMSECVAFAHIIPNNLVSPCHRSFCSFILDAGHTLRSRNAKESLPLNRSWQYENANILAIDRGEAGCVIDSALLVINSEIILFWSFSETSLDQGLAYGMQVKNSWMLGCRFVNNIPPGEELHFILVCRSKKASECSFV